MFGANDLSAAREPVDCLLLEYPYRDGVGAYCLVSGLCEGATSDDDGICASTFLQRRRLRNDLDVTEHLTKSHDFIGELALVGREGCVREEHSAGFQYTFRCRRGFDAAQRSGG